MILITGATGHLGTVTIDFLLKKLPPSGLAAFVRDEAKAADLAAKGVSIRVGDYDDTDALDRAIVGVDKVLLIAGGNAANGIQGRFRGWVNGSKMGTIRESRIGIQG